MSLRVRLGLAAAAAVAVAVALASVLVYFLVRDELRGDVDRTLQSQADRAAHAIFFPFSTPTGKPGVYLFRPRGLAFGDPNQYFQFVDRRGNVYRPDTYRPVSLPTQHARNVAAGAAAPFFTDATVNGVHLRVFTEPSQPNVAVQVSSALTNVDHELSKIRLWLFLVALGGIGLAAVAGFLVARAALKPVRDLSDTAERVRATRDLTQRIEIGGSDELSRLASTFNAMLESLDEASQRQRRLVQDASHELRTPLTSLRTNIEVLARGGDLPPAEREQLLHDVVEQLGEMTALISELTELARGADQQAPRQQVRLDLVAEEAIRRTSRNHPDVPIEAKLEPTTVVGLPESLGRAIANLLDNAAKWSPDGSPVEVRLADGELVVVDHGPGIADADLPHVFERFYRATSARSMPGSGLGLAIVQQVADAHGGTVTAERAPEGGTLMRFRLSSNGNGAARGARAPSQRAS
jgi:two-component system sensor histidine kinase MprB